MAVIDPASAPAGDAPTVLDYQLPSSSPPSRLRRALGLVGLLPLAVAAFLPFTFGISPLTVAVALASESIAMRKWDEIKIGMLALPMFLGLPIWLWQLRLLISGRATTSERVFAIVIASLSVGLTMAFVA